MSERYPGYDVLAKRHTPSWNEKTRQVIDERLALPREPRYLSQAEWLVLEAICERIVPQPRTRPPVPLAAMVDASRGEANLSSAIRVFVLEAESAARADQ